MLAISILALVAVGILGTIAGVSGLMRSKAKNIHGLPSRRSSQGTRIRKYIADRKWGIGLVLMFGISSVAVGIASTVTPSAPTTIDDGDGGDGNTDFELPDFTASGINPNLTRAGYSVTLSTKAPGAIPIFDPATRGTTSLWGLSVDKMRIAYYGTDNLWHETSFQLNEIGYRWIANDSTSSFTSGREDDYNTVGERPQSLLESLQWVKGYVPDRFYPDLRNKFWPDRSGLLPMDNAGTMMLNWPEFHASIAEETSAWPGGIPTTASQVRGALDYDDELTFLAQNGRKVENAIWYQSATTWTHRIEVDITDPVDNGHSWVYIFYNPTGIATAPTPRNQISNDYSKHLSYIAPGETDQVSFDKTTLTIVAANYRLAFDRYHASRFNNLRITLPGLLASNIFSEFPKDNIQMQGSIEFGGTTPYAQVRQGLFLHYGMCGNWYQNAPPGITANYDGMTGMLAGTNTVKDYDELQMGIGIIYHRGNPDLIGRGTGTASWAYGLQVTPTVPVLNGWRQYLTAGTPEGRTPLWFASINTGTANEIISGGTIPAVATDGAIAIRAQWQGIDRVAHLGTYNGYMYMDHNLYVRDAGTYVLLYRPWSTGWPYISSQNDVFAQSNPNWCDQSATIDGPAMCYIERLTSLKATVPLEWIRQNEAQILGLLAGGNSVDDGIVGNFDFYQQNDVVVFPNRLESRNNVYPSISLPSQILEPAIGTRVMHMYGNLKVMQFDQAIRTDTKIYMGPGANQADPVYGGPTGCMRFFLDANSAWINARNFPHYYGIQQLDTDGVGEIVRDYHPWMWMDEIPAVPAAWYSTGARVFTLDGTPSNDAVNYTANSAGYSGTTREYHPWWDYSGATLQYREQYLGTQVWRTHVRNRVNYRTAPIGTQGWNTETNPTARTPRNQNLAAVTVAQINNPSDWWIISVPGAGDVWVYQPNREVFELQSRGYSRDFQPPAAIMEYDQATIIKDSDMKEIGMYAARCTLGGSVIPMTLVWQFGNMGITGAQDALVKGKKEWVRNRFNLDSIFIATHQSPAAAIVNSFGPVNHGLFYKPGDTVNLESISNWNFATVVFNSVGGGITSTPATPLLTSGPTAFGSLYKHTTSFTWVSGAQGNNVGPTLGTRHDYYWVNATFGANQGTAPCGLLLDSLPPTAATFALAASNPSPVVVIDWSANKGSDNSDNTFPAPNNNGVKEYALYRGGSLVATVPYGTFTFVDDNGGAGFDNGTPLQYQLRTYDQAGNYASSAIVSTNIALPIDPAGRFNAQFNGALAGPGANDNPTAAYGNTIISWNLGAPYSATITSFEIMRSTSAASGYTTVMTGIGATTYTYTINWANPGGGLPASVADTYWFKLVSRSASGTVESAPMSVIYDPQPAGQPLPATIAWSAGPVYAPTERRVPIDVTGSGKSIDPGWLSDGNPLNTGSGIWRYLVYEMETDNPAVWPGSWTAVGTVDRATMESDVWYHNYALVNNRYYRYLVQSQDYSSPFPSATWPNGMVNSQYIEFRFSSANILANQLRVQSITTNQTSCDWMKYFTVSITVGNVGSAATTPTALNRFITQGGIDVTGAFFTPTGPVPALASIAAGASQTYVYTYRPRDNVTVPISYVIGQVLINAQVTWSGGTHTFAGDPASVTINAVGGGGPPPVPILSITNLVVVAPRGAPGPYIGGETFTLRVTYNNAGTASGTNVDGALTFGSYTYLSANDPLGVTVNAGATNTQDFTITVAAAATTAAVTITVTWTANGGYSGDSPADTVNVNIQRQAVVSITGLAISGSNGVGPYVAGMTFTLTVSYSNTGGTQATNVDAALTFGTYTYLTPTNPTGITLNAGATGTQVFTLTVGGTATTATVTITATWTGTETTSLRSINGDSPADTVNVNIQSHAAVSITGLAISGSNGAGPYVAGMTFTLTVSYSNTGGTQATNVDAALTFGTYTYLTPTNPTGITLNAGATGTQVFTLTVGGTATSATVTITATWTGTESITTNAINGDSPADTVNVNIQSHAAVSITNLAISGANGAGPYVAGMTFTLTVTYTNTGGTAANTVDGTLTFGGYASLSASNPTAITVNAGSTNTQAFTITVAAAAATATVTITATWTGTEAITALGISGDSPADTVNVGIQSHAAVSITNLAISGANGVGPYVGSMAFTLTVTFTNAGGTAGNNVDATLTYGSYTYLSASNPTGVTVAAGGTNTQAFTITAAAAATTATVTITAVWTGTEAITNLVISGDSPADTVNVNIQARAAVSITGLVISGANGVGPYVAGMTFTLTVSYSNTGGTQATNVDAALTFGTYTYLTPTNPTGITLNAGATGTQVFTLTVGGTATTATVTITATWTGTESISGSSISGDAIADTINVGIQSHAAVTITGLAISGSNGAGPYVAGMTFTLTVTFGNAGGTAGNTIDATLTFGSYTYLTASNPSGVAVAAGGTNTQAFTITVAALATTATVTITAVWTGTEAITGLGISGDSPSDTINVGIQTHAAVSITSLVISGSNGVGPYVGGMTFNLRVNYNNAGGTSGTADTTLTFGAYTYLSASNPTAVPVPAGNTAYQDFTITVAGAATSATVTISSAWTGNEAITNLVISGDSPADTVNVGIQSIANLYVDTVVLNTTATQVNRWVLATVNVRNSGGTSVTGVSVVLTFNNSYGINQAAVNTSTGLTVAAGGMVGVQIRFQISGSAPVGTGIRVDATASGTEAISLVARSDTTANVVGVVNVIASGVVTLTQVITSGRTTYVRGEQFVVRVTIDNSAGTDPVTAGALSLDFGVATGFSSNATTIPDPIIVGQIVVRDFLVTTTVGASASCNLRAHLTGLNPGALNLYASATVITTVAAAVVNITGVAVSGTNGVGPYVGGMGFTVTVTFQNTAASGSASATVDATLTFGSYSDLSASDPVAVTVAAASTTTQIFTISAAIAAASAVVTITATWSGTMQYSGATMSGDSPADTTSVTMQAQANVAITNLVITGLNGAGPYVAGMTFTLTVTYSNTGGTVANNVDGAVDDGTYTGLSWSNPTGIVVNSGATNTQAFTFTVGAAATSAAVTITATWAGTEAISGRTLNGDAIPDTIGVTIQSHVAVSITNLAISGANGVGPYVGSMAFTLTVTFTNAGGTAGNSVDATLAFGTYTHLTPTNPSGVTVAAGGSNTQVFTITAAAAATTAAVTITATWTGTEAITGLTISGDTPADTVIVNMQARAAVSITSLALTPIASPGPYVGGMTMTLTVTFSNTGGTSATVDATIDDGSYTGLTLTDNPAAVTVAAGGTQTQAFSVPILISATTAAVTITAIWTGTEAISGSVISGDLTPDTIPVSIQAVSNVAITNLAISGSNGAGPYVGGMTFTLTVTFSNTGGTAATVDATLTFGTYTFLSASNPSGVTVNNGATNTQAFTITAATTATTAAVTITAVWTGTEAISGSAISGDSPADTVNVNIQARAAVSITSLVISGSNGVGPYVGGMAFTLTVTFNNAGGTIANNIDATLTFGSYTFLSASNPSGVAVAAGGTNTQAFTITAATTATTAAVTITAVWTGTEAISNSAISGDSPADTVNVNIQARAAVSITSLVISGSNGVGPYVGGMAFTLTVTFNNAGGTIANNIDATLTFGSYTFLSASNPSGVAVAAGGTNTQAFTITAAALATTATATITAVWTGTEAISNSAISGDSPADTINVNIQAVSNVFVDTIALNSTSAPINRWVLATVTVRNTGGTAVTNGLVVLTFNATVGVTQVAVNQSSGLTLNAGASIGVQIRFQIPAGEPVGNTIRVQATFTGTEAITGTAISDVTANTPGNVLIVPSQVFLSQVVPSGRTTYVRGEQFVVRVTIDNSAGSTQVTSGLLSLDFGGAAGFSANTTYTGMTINIAQIVVRDFLVTTTVGAAASCNMRGHLTGLNPGALDIYSTTTVITTQAQAAVTITGLAISGTNGAGPYVAGMSFTLTVTFNNAGGTAATVDATMAFGTYTFLSASDPVAVTVAASSTNTQAFTITAAGGATTAAVTITATWTGTEDLSSRSINGDSPSDTVNVNIQSHAAVTISALAISGSNGAGPYVAGMSFTLTVTFNNAGGTAATVDATMAFGTYTFLSASDPVAVTVAASSTNTQAFTITAAGGATTAAVTITATWTGNEAISALAINGDSPADTVNVNMQSHAAVTISGLAISGSNGAGPYVAGMSFTLTVTFNNAGGTAATVDATMAFGTYTFLSASDPVAVTVAASSTNTQAFTITAAGGATTAAVTITATWTGNEAISGNAISGDSPADTVNVNIQSHAAVTITGLAISGSNGAGPYVAGMSFTLTVTFNNAGGTAATVDATMAFGTYTFLSASDPVAVSVAAGGSQTQGFTLTAAGAATTATVTITATWTGNEAISGNAISGDSPADTVNVNIQAHAAVTITSVVVSGSNGVGPYVASMSFTVTVTFDNAGGTSATVDATLSFGTYTHLSSNDPASVSVAAGNTQAQAFTITAAGTATTSLVTITAVWTGNEAISGNAISGDSPADTTTVNMQSYANVYVDTVALNATQAGLGKWVLATVTINNIGGTDAINGIVQLAFNSTYATNPTPVDATTGLTVVAGGSISVRIQFQISTLAPNNTIIGVNATFDAVEAFSGRALQDTAADVIGVVKVVILPVLVSLVIPSGRAAYVRGETFVVRATVDNSLGTTPITGGSLVLDFGAAVGFSSNTTTVADPIAIGAVIVSDFLVTTTGGASASCSIRAHFTGVNPGAVDIYSPTVAVTTQTPASVSITGLAISGSNGAGPYVAGMSFTLTVTFSNAGGTAATVDATLTFGTYTHLSSDNPASVVVAAGGTNTQAFSVLAASTATTATVTITATWTGNEAYTNATLSGDSPADTVDVDMQSFSAVSITSVVVSGSNGAGPYVAGMSFTVTVTFSNVAGGSAATVDAILTFGSYTFLSASDPVAVTVAAGSTNTQAFTVSVNAGASAGTPIITAAWTGTEEISGRAIDGDIPADTTTVTIQIHASVSITSLALSPISPGPYPLGTSFTLTVTFNNLGGTAATVDATVDDGTYTDLTWSNPSAVLVAASGTNTQVFTVDVAPAGTALTGVVLTVTWNGTEAITGLAINGDAIADTILANIIEGANVAITSITFESGTGTYVGGTSFTARVMFSNTGGTAVANIDALLTFGGYTYITTSDPSPVGIPAGGTVFQDFTLSVDPLATTQEPLVIGATWTGTDLGTGSSISGNQGANTLSVDILSQAAVTITGITYTTGTGTYVGGMTLTVRVTFGNTGGADGENVDAVLTYGGYGSLSASDPVAITVPGGSSASQDFTVTVAVAATSQNPVVIGATWTGTEEITGDALSGNQGANTLNVAIQAQANVELTVITAAGNVYAPSAVFNVFVTFRNTGATQANVDAVLSFTYVSNGTVYAFLSTNNPAGVDVAPGATVNQTIQVTVAANPANGLVLIQATWTGTEQYSARAINGVSLTPDTVQITREMLQIRSVSGANGRTGINTGTGVNTTVARGATFNVTVRVENIGSSPLAITGVDLQFWRDITTTMTSFTYTPLGASGSIAAGSIAQFTIWVTVPGSFTEYGQRFAITASVTGTYVAIPLSQDTAASPFESYQDRDSIVVVNSFLSVGFNSANPGLSIDVSTGIDVPVVMGYTISSTCWEPISINFINVLFSNLVYVVGGSIQVPADGVIVIPAGGSVVVWLNFTIDASAVSFTDTLDFSFDVINNNATKGLSQTSAAAQTLTLTSAVVVNSWSVDVLRKNGTIVLNTTVTIGYFDSLRLNVSASAPGAEIYMTIVASDNASISVSMFVSMTEIAPGMYTFTYAMSGMGRSNLMAAQERWLNISLVYRLGMVDYPLAEYGNVLFYIPAPLSFTTLEVAGTSINVASPPLIADVEASLVSMFRSTFVNSWTSAVTVEVLLSAQVPAAVQPGDILFRGTMVFSAGTWNWQISVSIPNIDDYWQAGLSPGILYAYFNVTDTYGNNYEPSEIKLMPVVTLHIVDKIAPVVQISSIVALAQQTLDPESTYELHVTVPVSQGESFVRQVVMYLSSTQPTGNSLNAWQNTAGVSTIRFSLISAATGDWMAVLPPQAGGSVLHWAFYVLDYAGNDNNADLTTSTSTLVYAPDVTQALEEPVGYALIGVMAFGLIFAISYRVQQGVQSVKKAKKVSAAVKKAAPGKTIGGSSSKTAISKDIPTKSCPICKAKIGADLDECPYCHKKF